MTAEPAVDAEPAPAKVNLALHVTGRRGDGYHLLDTIVVFPDIGDTVEARPAADLSMAVEGPAAGALADLDAASNLVMRAAIGLRALVPGRPGAALRLVKRLPVASGIGGGSADAAATIRLLGRLWGFDVTTADVAALALALGADVPMCLASRPARARGIGEALDPLTGVPDLGVVLANPGVAVPTSAVFRALSTPDNPPIATPPPADADGFVRALAACRNDLEAPARLVAPAIGAACDALAGLAGCRLVRMSGSGATCFALFDDEATARVAAGRLAMERPQWWVSAGRLDGGGRVSSRG
jgi:4-diphosphocytidyl-2-C-methyl-D-erythritol kinase